MYPGNWRAAFLFLLVPTALEEGLGFNSRWLVVVTNLDWASVPFWCLKMAYIKVSVMAKQKKERECFYHHIISKKWALEQVFLEFSVRASSFSATARKQALRVNSLYHQGEQRHKIHLDEKSSVLGCTLYGLVCHYQSDSQDWAEDQTILGSNIVFSILGGYRSCWWWRKTLNPGSRLCCF